MSTVSADHRTLNGERAALGCVMWDAATLVTVRRYLKPEDFGYEPHRHIFEAMCMRADRGESPDDEFTLVKEMERHGIKTVDAVAAASELYRAVTLDPEGRALVAHAAEYAREVLQAAIHDAHEKLGLWHVEASRHGLVHTEVRAGIAAEEARIADLERRIKGYDVSIDGDEDDAGATDAEILPDASLGEHIVATFPTAALPKPLRDLIEEGARAIGCPPDFIGVPALTAAGAAIGTSTCLEIKPGWRELPLLETATVAVPGSAKSPAADLANFPLVERQNDLFQQFKTDLAHYTEAEHDAATRGTIPEPILQQVWTSDATLEALGDVLEANPRGVLFLRDELAGWARSMNQYKGGKGADRQVWLSLWSCASVMINRRGRKVPQHIHRPFVAVSGTIQPDILGELSDERGREDGFIHRILFAYPEQMRRRWTEDTVQEVTRKAYSDLFEALWKLEPDRDEDGVRSPHALKFTEEGKKAWVAWITDHYDEIDAAGFPVNLRGPWAKFEGYAARLALIVHLCRRACEADSAHILDHDVDAASMLAAADLIDYFKSHARAVYCQLHTTPEDKQIGQALAWIQRQPEQQTTARNLVSAGIGGVSRAEAAKSLLRELAERGYGTVEERRSRHGRPTFIFRLTQQQLAPSNNSSARDGRAA